MTTTQNVDTFTTAYLAAAVANQVATTIAAGHATFVEMTKIERKARRAGVELDEMALGIEALAIYRASL